MQVLNEEAVRTLFPGDKVDLIGLLKNTINMIEKEQDREQYETLMNHLVELRDGMHTTDSYGKIGEIILRMSIKLNPPEAEDIKARVDKANRDQFAAYARGTQLLLQIQSLDEYSKNLQLANDLYTQSGLWNIA